MSKSNDNALAPHSIIDGLDLKSLVAKRTRSIMQLQKAAKIAEQTRVDIPDGIAAHGTDALRFTFAAQATMGRDVVFDLKRVEGYRNFCNKLWNAARFVLMQTEGKDIDPKSVLEKTEPADQWIYKRLNIAIESVIDAFESYRYDFAAQAIYNFIWNDYCDK